VGAEVGLTRARHAVRHVSPSAATVIAMSQTSAPAERTVEVRRSKRRRRTVSAYREGDRIVVLIPASLTRAQEAEWVETMVARIERAEARRRPTDAELMRRATSLSDAYLDGQAVPSSVRWVDNQRSRWGSCTPADRTIRLSRRLEPMPDWVVDYVLVHELAHLVEAGHNARFWALVERYPQSERAKAWLDGYSAGARLEGPADSTD
jgi:predicted metal-dependent hydrolase